MTDNLEALCKAAMSEKDPQRLMFLINEILELLKDQRKIAQRREGN